MPYAGWHVLCMQACMAARLPAMSIRNAVHFHMQPFGPLISSCQSLVARHWLLVSEYVVNLWALADQLCPCLRLLVLHRPACRPLFFFMSWGFRALVACFLPPAFVPPLPSSQQLASPVAAASHPQALRSPKQSWLSLARPQSAQAPPWLGLRGARGPLAPALRRPSPRKMSVSLPH